MKTFVLLMVVASCLIGCNSNETNNSETKTGVTLTDEQKQAAASDSSNFTSIQWIDSTSLQLGSIKKGEVVEVAYRFKNTGDKQLIITDVTAGCGCTVPEKPKEPYSPGAEGVIKAKFDSKGREGAQRKDVYVTANTGNTTNHILSFAVEVQKK